MSACVQNRQVSIPPFGPLLHNMVVSRKIVGHLVRLTAMTADYHAHMVAKMYSKPYPSRQRVLDDIMGKCKKELSIARFYTAMFHKPVVSVGEAAATAIKDSIAGGVRGDEPTTTATASGGPEEKRVRAPSTTTTTNPMIAAVAAAAAASQTAAAAAAVHESVEAPPAETTATASDAPATTATATTATDEATTTDGATATDTASDATSTEVAETMAAAEAEPSA